MAHAQHPHAFRRRFPEEQLTGRETEHVSEDNHIESRFLRYAVGFPFREIRTDMMFGVKRLTNRKSFVARHPKSLRELGQRFFPDKPV